MSVLWRKKTLTLCVSAAITQLGIDVARADPAEGLPSGLGNALNPTTLSANRARDPETLDASPDERTPTGKLIAWPYLVPETSATPSGWTYQGTVELGGLRADGDTDNALYSMYKDLPDEGLYLNNFHVQADQLEPGKGYFLEALGGGLGYRDQYGGVNFGRYNDWKIKIFYNEIPHTYTSTYRSLWSGVGGDDLTLDTLKPGGTRVPATGTPNAANSQAATIANLEEAIAATPDSELSLVRRTGGMTFDKYISNAWRLYTSYSREHREGARPFGAVFGGGGGGGSVEIPESIDYDTHNILAALRYDDGVNNLNLQANASLFRNNIDTMTFENPLYVTTNTIAAVSPNVLDPTRFTTGTYDLYPNNDSYNVRAEYGRSMPNWLNSRLTATVSLSTLRQDDDLVAPTTLDLQGISINGVSAYNNWNTTRALSQTSANAQIDTQLFDVGLVMRPTDKLDVKGKIRYYGTDNKTDYLSCNPLTGQWGRLLNDGSGGAFVVPNTTAGNNPTGTSASAYNTTGCNLEAITALGLVPSAGNVNIRSVPYEYRQTNFELSGDYRIARGQSINARIEREQFQREHRERDQTWEDMLKLGYVNRAFAWGTIRASAEYGERRGDTYRSDPYHAFYSASLGPEPTASATNVASWVHAMSSFRKLDLADRDRLALDLRLDLITRPDLDIGLTGQYRSNAYPDSNYGRTDKQKVGTAGIDLNWQPSSKLGIHAFYSYQESSLSQAGVQPNGCVIGTYYYVYSDGFVGNGTTLNAPSRAGASLVNTVLVTSDDWSELCADQTSDSPLWTDGRAWQVDSADTNHAFGIGGRYDFGFARLELDYTYVTGTSSLDYSYNAAALAQTEVISALAGTGLPDMKYSQHALSLNLVVPVSKSVALRAIYRYEEASVDDWHYVGVSENPVPVTTGSQAVYLDSGAENYHNNVIGLMVQVSF